MAKNTSARKEITPDRRVRRTKALLTKALVSLLETKSIKDISVKELCETADINRGTFYLHYQDIYDLIEQLEREFIDQIELLLPSPAQKDLFEDPYPLIYDVFRLTAENAPLCCALLGKNGDISFLLQLKNLFRKRLFDLWIDTYPKKENAEFEYTYDFVVSGCIGLIEHWLFSPQTESPEEMAKLASDIITTGIHSLTKNYE